MKKFIFSKIKGLEPATLLKLNFFIDIFQGFYCEFNWQLSELLFLRTPFFQNTYTDCFLSMANIEI